MTGGLAVRIAVSGTHMVGKSTLVEALGDLLPDHTVVAEPYERLESRGYEFDHPPSLEDYVVQLRQSIGILRRPARNLILDRCPLDFLGYIYASPGAERFDIERWRTSLTAAMASLDLVVSLRVEPRHEPGMLVEDMPFRLAVDELLRDIVDGDGFDLCEGVEILILGGPWDDRVATVMAHIHAMHSERPGALNR